MPKRFNPPANWPKPPAGWTPPPGWQPDPAWGPAPAGHKLWVGDRNWFIRHKVLTAIGALFLVGVVGSAIGGGDTGSTTPAARANDSGHSATPTPTDTAAAAKASAEAAAQASAEAKASAEASASAAAEAAAKKRAEEEAAKPVVYSGTGNKLIKFKKPFTDARLMTTSWTGADGNITAYAIMPDGTEGDLLVNAIGHYHGQTPFNTESDDAVAIKVEGGGSWTIKLEPLTAAKRWDGSGTFKGSSDGVVVVKDTFQPVDSIKFVSRRAEGNVTMEAYTTDGNSELVVNDIGNFSGEFMVPNNSALLVIKSDGDWTMTKT